ncbi:uncharacterized protein LOC142334891 [Convolutriloba macropyga]|uniref:uncharacterized protein LOC142334891 n=1 Tax=Convolutriloba macropyga TaxID=536237 RepID=UPI003F52878D
MGQLRSLEKRLQKDDTLRQRYQETIDTDVKAGYVRKIDQTELNETRDELQWYLPHHPVINPHKPEKVRRVCNAAVQYQGVALTDKLLSGPDLLQSLVGIIFRFREHQIALSADIEAMFLQIGVPGADSRCLRFLWRDNPEQRIEVYECTRHLFGAKSSPTCAKYALHQVAKDNANNDENLVRTVQRNFYMDDFLKSVRTPQEATQIYQKFRDVLSKGGFKLTKWITSDEKVKSQISETDRSTKVVKTFEAEPQLSSILGLNWNVDTDTPIRHTTIPKLELQAAVYGVRLKRQIVREHDVKIDKVYLWTDSSTVLQWLQSAHKKQQVFVANRAAEILESSSMYQWRHVKCIENPADIGTRGMSIEGLKESTLNIAKLSPFIVEDKTIRVKGRLKHSNLDYNAKHPILLTAKHPVVQLLLERVHRDDLHEGTEYVRNVLQQEIIGLRNSLRKLKSKCIRCRHRNANPIHPPMADLPRERLDEYVFPFTHTGVDYFGPIEVKFLRPAVTRFITQRGYPSTIISDNGTNLVGAAKELKAFMDEWDRAKIEGRESASAPFMPSSERYHDLRKSFKTAQAYACMIWKRWTREYLPQWNQRSKWSKEHVRNLKEGELVWMVGESVRRSEYKMGRGIQVFKGHDGVVQSARVKMAHVEFNRPVVKLAPVL